MSWSLFIAFEERAEMLHVQLLCVQVAVHFQTCSVHNVVRPGRGKQK